MPYELIKVILKLDMTYETKLEIRLDLECRSVPPQLLINPKSNNVVYRIQSTSWVYEIDNRTA